MMEDVNDWVANKLKEVTSRKPEHTYRTFAVDQLVRAKIEGELINAAANRDPVWPESKQSDYVFSVLAGTSCNTFLINQVRTKSNDLILEIYDGINRLTALENFMTGKMPVVLNKGTSKVKIWYTDGQIKESIGCVKMSDSEKRKFGMRSIDVFIFDNLSPEEACDRAIKE